MKKKTTTAACWRIKSTETGNDFDSYDEVQRFLMKLDEDKKKSLIF